MSKGGGLLSLYMLHLLAEKPRYGNDIMRELEGRTHGRWASNPGAIYPLLTAMEDSGLVVSEWEDPDKRTRRIYRLTPEGQGELERLKEVMRPKLEEAIDVLRDLYNDLDIDEEA
jgi:DNA-binding PadR family transcriptional regulator